MTTNEEAFPRGGKTQINKNKTKKRKDDTNLFGVNKQVAKPKKQKTKHKETEEEKSAEPHLVSTDILSYKKIQDGMLILGCISKIKTVVLEIELPGRTQGNLLLKNISNKYIEEINKKIEEGNVDTNDLTMLNKIFTIGQYLPVKVLSITEGDNGPELDLSSNPSEVNSNLRYNKIKAGTLIWGAIVEKSDHCYFVDVGVKKCRAVLPFKNIDQGKDYEIGQVLYMIVKKSDIENEASTLTLSANEKQFKEYTQKDIPIDELIPGMQIEFTIEKILKNGLEGSFFTECLGYVNEIYLKNPLDTLRKYHEGQTMNARVLYTQPITKFTYLTLALDASPVSLQIGTNEKAKILNKIAGGLLIKINDKRGFVTNRRLINTLMNENGNLDEVILNKFPIGSEHTCRILSYNPMDRLYICTFEPQLIKEKFFSINDIKCGDKVDGVIKHVNNYGIVVKFGQLEGFVPNLHLSSVEYSENLKKKFKEGMKVSAKVLIINKENNNIKLTMKPELLKEEKCLLKFNKAKKNTQYIGVVVHKNKDGFLVAFYGNVRGFLPVKNIPHLQEDVKNMFYIGQAIKTYVVSRSKGKMTLSLEGGDIEEPVKAKKNKTKEKDDDEGIASRSEEDEADETIKEEDDSEVEDTSDIEIKEESESEDKSIKKKNKNKKDKVETKKDKKKLNDILSNVEIKEESESDVEESNKVKAKNVNNKKQKDKKKDDEKEMPANESSAVLPSIGKLFSKKRQIQEVDDNSSGDEDLSEKQPLKKKKGLTPAERAQRAREEDERIRQIENKLADTSAMPETSEQFDRLLLGDPENTELWLKYIAFHAQSTEFDKARMVIKRALEAIPYTSTQSRLNIWISSLNLENMYGTKESFEKVFMEACRTNDALTIHLEAINMLADVSKLTEMDEKIKKARGKFKQESKMWLVVGKVLYKILRFSEARKLREAAVLTLQDKRLHHNMLVQFAILEMQLGERAQGEALFETILHSDAKRVDVWCTYVDQLIKLNEIDLARRVLKRAVGQKLNVKKSKTLFKKYRAFEEANGNVEDKEYLKKILQEYEKPSD